MLNRVWTWCRWRHLTERNSADRIFLLHQHIGVCCNFIAKMKSTFFETFPMVSFRSTCQFGVWRANAQSLHCVFQFLQPCKSVSGPSRFDNPNLLINSVWVKNERGQMWEIGVNWVKCSMMYTSSMWHC